MQINIATAPSQPVRLHYLDWLRVIAILIVFLFHALHPFDMLGWHIKNAEQSLPLTIFQVLLSIWGMAFFFLISGTGSWFALRRRTPGQYASERFKRLAVPFVFGALVFMPVMLYFEWAQDVMTGETTRTFAEFAARPILGFTPGWFGAYGYHLWFLGFLFSFSLLFLPLFMWWKQPAGKPMLDWMARMVEKRGGILLYILPLTLIRFAVVPFDMSDHGWGDFTFQGAFFVLGFIFYSDPRFAQAIRRDWWILLAGGMSGVLALFVLYFFGDPFGWASNPAIPQFYLMQFIVAVMALCWSVFLFYIGMRFLPFTNRLLEYAQRAVLPFYVLHQPVIMVIAFFVVQWSAGIPIKAVVVISASLAVCLVLYEYVIRRISLLQTAFGMTAAEGVRAPGVEVQYDRRGA